MGNCMSSGGGDDEGQKKKSQAIDRGLEEDSKKLRRECKILLLGTFALKPILPRSSANTPRAKVLVRAASRLLSNR
jgi:hypothetical protein